MHLQVQDNGTVHGESNSDNEHRTGFTEQNVPDSYKTFIIQHSSLFVTFIDYVHLYVLRNLHNFETALRKVEIANQL